MCLLVMSSKPSNDVNAFQTYQNKTLWERILGRRCIRDIGMYISWESACTSVQGLMIGSTEYWDSLVCMSLTVGLHL